MNYIEHHHHSITTVNMTPVDQLTYEQALAELEQILREMQSDQCDIDKLSEKTRRAAALLACCRAKLTATEAELKQILDSIDPAE